MPDLPRNSDLVLDTSVWINLIATDQVEQIVRALGATCFAPEQVLGEIKRHPATGAVFTIDTHPLNSLSPSVAIVRLDASELQLFLEIVSVPAVDALGDGEAAAIAVAIHRKLDIVLDDRKARRIIREKFANLRTWWTVDILRSSRVRKALGQQLSDECWRKATQFGRMHIPS